MTKPAIAKNVSIVVPVYGDWESLEQCISSLKQCVSGRHRVLFVNDRGPEHDLLEKRITAAIKGHENFAYFANDGNLGFLKNCNNAVNCLDDTDNDILLLNSDTVVTPGFLEELIDVAYLSSAHGTVCPRSSDATIASIPLNARDENTVITPEASYQMYQKIKDDLPRYTVSPVSVGFCFYVKRSLIHKIGLFDEVFGKGYGEEDDFCMRINKLGYVSVIANQAFVYHLGARSFTAERRLELVSENAKILLARHPYFDRLVRNYLEYETNFCEVFAQTITEATPSSTIKLLLDLHSLPPQELPETALIRHILSSLKPHQQLKVVVATSGPTQAFLNVKNPAFTYKEPSDIHEQFDVGLALFYVRDINNLAFLQRTTARLVVTQAMLNQSRLSEQKIHADQTMIMKRTIAYADLLLEVPVAEFLQHASIAHYLAANPINLERANDRWLHVNEMRAMFDVQLAAPAPPRGRLARLRAKARS